MSEFDKTMDCVELFDKAVRSVAAKQDLPAHTIRDLVRTMMKGLVPDTSMKEFLTCLHQKGETAQELVGAAEAMREFMTPIRTTRVKAIDTCGTGGGGTNSFNISTAVALVCAAAGATVAKHGNRRSTSRSGSSDVLELLGVNILADITVVERCLNELGVCFCFAPLFHPSVKQVMSVRRALPHPTVFNLLGPLCNPAGTKFQLLGVGRGETRMRIAQALNMLGTEHSLVVHGRDGLGEISLAGPTDVSEIVNGQICEHTIDPESFGFSPVPLHEIQVESPAESATKLLAVLADKTSPARDIVLLNAAVALKIVGIGTNHFESLERAREAISSGRARRILKKLVELTNA